MTLLQNMFVAIVARSRLWLNFSWVGRGKARLPQLLPGEARLPELLRGELRLLLLPGEARLPELLRGELRLLALLRGEVRLPRCNECPCSECTCFN